jgi:hypothetical protein
MVSTICEGGWLRFRGEREQKGSSLQSDNEVRRKGGKKRGEEDERRGGNEEERRRRRTLFLGRVLAS